jgi:hypothetical protein
MFGRVAALSPIAEVLSIVPAASQPVQAAAESAPAPVPTPEPAAPAMADIAPPSDAQVIAALGQPDKTEKVGLKDIYHYETMTVTLTSGKVSNVQQ